MSISKELGDSLGRFKVYIDSLIALLERHEIRSVLSLIDAFRKNREFSDAWKAIWLSVAAADGGKISFTTAGAIVGAVLGGVGIAAGGGAFGLPLVLVLGLGGLITGAEFDSVRTWNRTKLHFLRLPRDLHSRIAEAARAAEISENELIVNVLAASFPDPAELQ